MGTQQDTLVDEYTWWREALNGKFGPISDGDPQCGRYKMRRKKDGPYLPVAIYKIGDEIMAAVSEKPTDAESVWTYCAKNPIDNETYRIAVAEGKFPDDVPPLEQRSNISPDPFVAMVAEIDDRSAQAEKWLADHPDITTQQDCNLARNMQAALLKLRKDADQMHKDEKAPVLQAQREVDDKYRFRDGVKLVADKLRGAFERFLKAEDARLRAEAQKKFEAERAVAEAKRKAIEDERAQKMRDDPIAALTEAPEDLPDVPLAPEAVKVSAGGGFGRKAGLKTVYVGVIEKYKDTLDHFADHPDVKALIDKLVKSAVRAGKDTTKIPGVKVVEDRSVA